MRIKTSKPLIVWSVLIAFLIGMTVYLYMQGRVWIAASGKMYIWTSDATGPDCSQHLLDPYSFSHFLHGIIFFFLLSLVFKKFSLHSKFVASVLMEGCWEMLENSAIIINRYRDATAALGYNGDSIFNSYGDLIACSLGFFVARYVGWKWSIVIFVAAELFCLWWIKDNLTLNVIMLIYPIDGIKEWQLAG
jgi:hypothetical protein